MASSNKDNYLKVTKGDEQPEKKSEEKEGRMYRAVQGDTGDLEMQTQVPASTVAQMREAESTNVLVARRISSSMLARRVPSLTLVGRTISKLSDGDSTGSVERRLSNMEIAVQRRLSNSVIPDVLQPKSVRPTLKQMKKELEAHPKEMKYTEHLFDMYRLSEFFKCHIDENNIKQSRGLTSDQATFLLQEYGPNSLTPPPRVPLWMLFLLQFLNIFMLLLVGAGILSIVAFLINPSDPINLYLGIILLVVVVATCWGTYSQEAKSGKL